MNRSLKLSMLVALALGSSQVLALDMGQIQVKSALWQPLLAEIPISPATPAELKGMTVQLASNEDFIRAGIVGGRTTVPLNFSVVTSGGRPVIRITSTVAVNDPYLDLLIEVNGHAGKSVREFAILLDPPNSSTGPVAASAAPAPARAAVDRPVHSAPKPSSPRPSHTPTAAKPAGEPAAAGKGQYGPVEQGETLSSIARGAASSAGVSTNQMLMALKQANPDAFYHDNINALKRGAILRIPSAADAQALAAAAAVAEVQRQNSDWRAGRVGKSTAVADTATRASTSSAPTSTGNTSTDRLALVSASDQSGSSDQSGRAGGKGDKSSAGIRQELQRTQESLASVQQQGSDLKVRLQDLTDINSKNQHLLSLKDSEIADLQNKLAAARKAAGLPPQPAPVIAAPASVPAPSAIKPATAASTPVTASSVASTPVAASTVGAMTTPATTATSAAPAAAASATASVKPVPVVIRPSPAPVVDDPWYMQTWAWAAGAGAIVVLVLLAALGRRRKAAADEFAPSSASLADRFGAESAGHDPSDIDQNELLDQLAEHPDDIGLHLELVTLYYSRRDVDHFEAAAEAMHAHITDTDQDEWQDVLHMGEDLAPGHPLFDHHVELPPQEIFEARRAFDLDDYSSDLPPQPLVESTETKPPVLPPLPLPPSKMVSEYHFNFDLSTPERSAATETEHESEHAASAGEALTDEPPAVPAKPASSWQFDEPVAEHKLDELSNTKPPALDDFNDDPIDTKLDLARAYVDMGDADGARAMLGEVIKEGTQIQQDVARRLLETLH